MSDVLILGCGVVGTLVGEDLASRGHKVIGVTRSAAASVVCLGFELRPGDLADPAWYDALGAQRFDAVLLAANPGLRRGRDNRLAEGARLVSQLLPGARFVYTGSTAVYADAKGADVDEDAALALDDPAVVGLVAIERAVLTHSDALVLRATALVGPTRTHALDRVRTGNCVVHGRSDRPFSYVHERDLAEICVEALLGSLGRGVLNVASPERLTLAEYYATLARRAGVVCQIIADGDDVPSRRIDARRLHALCPEKRWRFCDQ